MPVFLGLLLVGRVAAMAVRQRTMPEAQKVAAAFAGVYAAGMFFLAIVDTSPLLNVTDIGNVEASIGATFGLALLWGLGAALIGLAVAAATPWGRHLAGTAPRSGGRHTGYPSPAAGPWGGEAFGSSRSPGHPFVPDTASGFDVSGGAGTPGGSPPGDHGAPAGYGTPTPTPGWPPPAGFAPPTPPVGSTSGESGEQTSVWRDNPNMPAAPPPPATGQSSWPAGTPARPMPLSPASGSPPTGADADQTFIAPDRYHPGGAADSGESGHDASTGEG
jgi:hypothetical protein